MVMWDEGPGTPGSPNHHDIMAKTDDAALGCGFYVDPADPANAPGGSKFNATITVEFIDSYCTNGGSGSLCQ
jgi:hypothetical protein